jgi:hypothetical protein
MHAPAGLCLARTDSQHNLTSIVQVMEEANARKGIMMTNEWLPYVRSISLLGLTISLILWIISATGCCALETIPTRRKAVRPTLEGLGTWFLSWFSGILIFMIAILGCGALNLTWQWL